MTMSSIPCRLLLGLSLIVLVAGGCKEQQEPAPPPRPAMVRKKIEVPPPVVQAAKPADQEGAEPAEPTTTAMVTKPVEAPQPPGAETVKPSDQEAAKPETAERPPDTEAPEQAPEAKPALPEEPDRKLAYVYDPKGKLDPFQSVFVTQPRGRRGTRVEVTTRETRLPLTPLQKIDLSQLKVVGIMMIPSGNKALVEDPSGKGYVITKGTYVGANFGRVRRILKDRIIVEEEVEDFFSGQMRLQTTELRIQKRLELEASEDARGR